MSLKSIAAVLFATGTVLAGGLVATAPASAAPAPQLAGCHIESLVSGLAVREAPNLNSTIDSRLGMHQYIPSACAKITASINHGCRNDPGETGYDWFPVYLPGRSATDYVVSSGDCDALHLV